MTGGHSRLGANDRGHFLGGSLRTTTMDLREYAENIVTVAL